jgi:hypothetical protein
MVVEEEESSSIASNPPTGDHHGQETETDLRRSSTATTTPAGNETSITMMMADEDHATASNPVTASVQLHVGREDGSEYTKPESSTVATMMMMTTTHDAGDTNNTTTNDVDQFSWTEINCRPTSHDTMGCLIVVVPVQTLRLRPPQRSPNVRTSIREREEIIDSSRQRRQAIVVDWGGSESCCGGH